MAYRLDAKLAGNHRKNGDNMALVAESWDDLKATLDPLPEHCRDLALTISYRKTKTQAGLPLDLCQRPECVS